MSRYLFVIFVFFSSISSATSLDDLNTRLEEIEDNITFQQDLELARIVRERERLEAERYRQERLRIENNNSYRQYGYSYLAPNSSPNFNSYKANRSLLDDIIGKLLVAGFIGGIAGLYLWMKKKIRLSKKVQEDFLEKNNPSLSTSSNSQAVAHKNQAEKKSNISSEFVRLARARSKEEIFRLKPIAGGKTKSGSINALVRLLFLYVIFCGVVIYLISRMS